MSANHCDPPTAQAGRFRPLLGLNVYLWQMEDQDLLLSRCIAPLVRRLRRERLLYRLHFDRFDARGPHVFLILTLSGAEALATVESALRQGVADHLARHPLRYQPTLPELEVRHRGCRGVDLCQADRLPGIAESGSWEIFAHHPRDNPFWWTRDMAEAEAFWELWDLCCEEHLGRLGQPRATGIHWLAMTDRLLREHGEDVEAYWRFHMGTLVHSFPKRWQEDSAGVLERLPGALGERNRRALAAAWHAAREAEMPPHLAQLHRLTLSPCAATAANPWLLRREVDHAAVKQLGLCHSLQIPAVLYAWYRTLCSGGVVAA